MPRSLAIILICHRVLAFGLTHANFQSTPSSSRSLLSSEKLGGFPDPVTRKCWEKKKVKRDECRRRSVFFGRTIDFVDGWRNYFSTKLLNIQFAFNSCVKNPFHRDKSPAQTDENFNLNVYLFSLLEQKFPMLNIFFASECIKIMRKRDVCEFLIGRFSCPCYLPNYIRKKPFHGTFFSCQNNFCEEDCNWQRKSVFILVATKYEKWTKKKSLLSCMKDSCTTQQLFNQLVTYTATDLFIKLVGSIKENKRKRRITEFALKTSFFCEFRSRFY